MRDPRDVEEDDQSMTHPRVFSSEEEAFAAPTAEELWLESLDQPTGDDE